MILAISLQLIHVPGTVDTTTTETEMHVAESYTLEVSLSSVETVQCYDNVMLTVNTTVTLAVSQLLNCNLDLQNLASTFFDSTALVFNSTVSGSQSLDVATVMNSTITSSELAGTISAALENVLFVNCSFTDVQFSGSIENVSFELCTFTQTTALFTEASVSNVVIIDSALTSSANLFDTATTEISNFTAVRSDLSFTELGSSTLNATISIVDCSCTLESLGIFDYLQLSLKDV
jgi:hypothetical protein